MGTLNLRPSQGRSLLETSRRVILRTNAPPATLPTFTAAWVGGLLVITFSRAVLNTPQLADPSQYAVTPPVGAGAVTVAGAQVGASSVSLALTGDVYTGGTYAVALPANLARATDTGEGNAAGSASFAIAGAALRVASATPLSATQLRVKFSKPVKQLSALNADDALNPANYAITGPAGALTVTAVAAASSDAVDLTTAAEAPLQYTLTVSNVQDLAGNVI